MQYDRVIIGGGIVGLATGLAILEKDPDCRLAILEKEARWAAHQSGRNSGVIHAGVYYKPGSKKADFAVRGNTSMVKFCQQHHIKYEQCGKLIVASSRDQIPALENLQIRATQNGLAVERMHGEQAREIEPHVNCMSALHVPSTGIVDYQQVADKYAELLHAQGATLLKSTRVKGIKDTRSGWLLATDKGVIETAYLISTSGLFSDRIARLAGIDPGMKIVPFRGEYWHLNPERAHLVRNLIYPVPNPNFPFLGVHMTRLIDGSIHAGPNAVLAFSREGYSWAKIDLMDTLETLTYGGFWKLAGEYLGEGLKEMYRSVMKSAFLRSVQELIPEINAEDLHRGDAGVRAQALWSNGRLLDDFHMIQKQKGIFVLNAPSPAATASLEIGKYICAQIYAS